MTAYSCFILPTAQAGATGSRSCGWNMDDPERKNAGAHLRGPQRYYGSTQRDQRFAGRRLITVSTTVVSGWRRAYLDVVKRPVRASRATFTVIMMASFR